MIKHVCYVYGVFQQLFAANSVDVMILIVASFGVFSALGNEDEDEDVIPCKKKNIAVQGDTTKKMS